MLVLRQRAQRVQPHGVGSALVDLVFLERELAAVAAAAGSPRLHRPASSRTTASTTSALWSATGSSACRNRSPHAGRYASDNRALRSGRLGHLSTGLPQ